MSVDLDSFIHCQLKFYSAFVNFKNSYEETNKLITSFQKKINAISQSFLKDKSYEEQSPQYKEAMQTALAIQKILKNKSNRLNHTFTTLNKRIMQFKALDEGTISYYALLIEKVSKRYKVAKENLKKMFYTYEHLAKKLSYYPEQ